MSKIDVSRIEYEMNVGNFKNAHELPKDSVQKQLKAFEFYHPEEFAVFIDGYGSVPGTLFRLIPHDGKEALDWSQVNDKHYIDVTDNNGNVAKTINAKDFIDTYITVSNKALDQNDEVSQFSTIPKMRM